MLKKRLLVLAVMLCLLVVAYTSKSASAEGYCSCAMACEGGSAVCYAGCGGDSLRDMEAAAAACCRGAKEATPMNCSSLPQ